MFDIELNTILQNLEYEENAYIGFINKKKQIVIYNPIYNINFINYILVCSNIYIFLLYFTFINSLIINNLHQIQS